MDNLIVFLNTYNVFILVAIVLAYFWFVSKQRAETVRIFLSVMLAAVISLALKYFFNYPRPFEVEQTSALAGLSTSPSFPSLHTAVAFAAATNVTFHKRSIGLALLMAAVIIGLGRILADVHYPLDVFMGVIIGMVIAVFIETLYLPWKKRSRR
jgi:membrane-associated phospholipid phosphatase